MNVFEGIFADKLIAQSVKSGEKYEVIPRAVLPLGEYRAIASTPHQKAVKAKEEVSVNKLLYTEQEESNIVRLPLASQTREIIDPADTGKYGSAKAAMLDFLSMVAPMYFDPQTRARLHEEFINNGLSKAYIKGLAIKLINSAESAG